MTVVYEGSFLKAIFRWHGSVYKSIWRETLVWLLFYFIIRIIFTYLPDGHEDAIKRLVRQFNDYTRSIPLEFLLGFYVQQTVSRWWSQAMLISSPHELMGIIVAYIYESDEESQRIRHTIARYLILYYAMAYKNVSSKLRKIFPSNDSFVSIGLLTQEEHDILGKVPKGVAHEIVYQWVIEMIREKAGNHKIILNTMNTHRANIKQLCKHNDLALPLVYTQTVTIAVYGYFLFTLIGHQFYRGEPNGSSDIIFPVFTLLRFIFSIGWLKVAEDLSKPFGDDDDDIDLCKYLSKFCDNIFTVANYTCNHKPINSWKIKNDSDIGKIKNAFDHGTTRFERMGQMITRNFKKVMICGSHRNEYCVT